MASRNIEAEEYLTDPGTDEESDMESLDDQGAYGYSQPGYLGRDTIPRDSPIPTESSAKAREVSEQRADGSRVAQSQLSSAAASLRSVAWTMPELENAPEAPPPTYESISGSRTDRFAQQRGIEAPMVHGGSYAGPMAFSDSPPHPRQTTMPQSMRDAMPDEETSLLGSAKPERKMRRFPFCQSISVCNAVVTLAVVMLVLLILGAMTGTALSDQPQDDGGSGGHAPTSPPAGSWPPGAPDSPVHSSCDLHVSNRGSTIVFPRVSNFTFLELMERSEFFNGQIDGRIVVRPAPDKQTADLLVSVTYATSEQWALQASNYVQSSDALTLQLPTLSGTDARNVGSCLGVFVTIDVRRSALLNNWELVTGNLNIEVEDGLFDLEDATPSSSYLNVMGSSSFNAISGYVKMAYWSARRTEIETISGSIRGSYALRDLLSIKSVSGSIAVNVSPKEEDSNEPSPAEFTVHSSSGSVKAQFPTSGDIPIRNYRTRIETSSAAITGTYILGMLTSFHTQSGILKTDLLPVYDSTDDSIFRTDTKSASQILTILPPHSFPGKSFAKLHSDHKFVSTSGTLRVQYPDDWEGSITGDTISGSIKITGKDVKMSRERGSSASWPFNRHVVASKGDGEGRLKFSTVSGSVVLQMGEQ